MKVLELYIGNSWGNLSSEQSKLWGVDRTGPWAGPVGPDQLMGHACEAGHHPKLPKTARNGRLAVERLPGATASATALFWANTAMS